MRHIIAIATVSLAGLSFSSVAAAQRHSDPDSVDRSRPDRTSIQRERLEVSRMSADSQRTSATERYQESPNRERPQSGEAGRPTMEHPSTEVSVAIQRVANRGTNGGEDGPSRVHDAAATQSSSYTSAHPQSQQVQQMSVTTAAAIRRIEEHGTSGGEDSSSNRSHDAAATQSNNRATAQAGAPAVQQPSVTTAAAMHRIAEHGTSGGEDSGHTHEPVAPHSSNREN